VFVCVLRVRFTIIMIILMSVIEIYDNLVIPNSGSAVNATVIPASLSPSSVTFVYSDKTAEHQIVYCTSLVFLHHTK